MVEAEVGQGKFGGVGWGGWLGGVAWGCGGVTWGYAEEGGGYSEVAKEVSGRMEVADILAVGGAGKMVEVADG